MNIVNWNLYICVCSKNVPWYTEKSSRISGKAIAEYSENVTWKIFRINYEVEPKLNEFNCLLQPPSRPFFTIISILRNFQKLELVFQRGIEGLKVIEYISPWNNKQGPGKEVEIPQRLIRKS